MREMKDWEEGLSCSPWENQLNNSSACSTASEDSDEVPKRKTTGPIHNPRYKAKMCRNFIRDGVCNYFEKCQFAHGAEELEKWRLIRKRVEEAKSQGLKPQVYIKTNENSSIISNQNTKNQQQRKNSGYSQASLISNRSSSSLSSSSSSSLPSSSHDPIFSTHHQPSNSNRHIDDSFYNSMINSFSSSCTVNSLIGAASPLSRSGSIHSFPSSSSPNFDDSYHNFNNNNSGEQQPTMISNPLIQQQQPNHHVQYEDPYWQSRNNFQSPLPDSRYEYAEDPSGSSPSILGFMQQQANQQVVSPTPSSNEYFSPTQTTVQNSFTLPSMFQSY